MQNTITYLLAICCLASCNFSVNTNLPQDKEITIVEVDSLMNDWHKAAANADYEGYMGAMADESIYIGTDASENWTKPQFEAFCKPYFDKKTTWHFTAFERNIYLSDDNDVAWFDELLKTQMGVCRGSGILEKKLSGWKIKHYVLSMTIPNDNSKEVTEIKKVIDASFFDKYNLTE